MANEPMIKRITIANNNQDKYLRVKKNLTSTYQHPVTQTTKVVPGIILSAMSNVLRTEGIIVEALLGEGDALDTYSHGLQDETVKAKILSNALLETEVKKNEMAMQIVKEKNSDAAKVFEQVFPLPKIQEKEKSPND
jgi:hypothetical protein